MQATAAASNGRNNEEVFEGHRLFKRSKEAQSGFVPRVIMGDLAESTGHVLIAGQSTVATAPKHGLATHRDVGGEAEEMLLWDGSLNRIQQESYPVHPFQVYQQSSTQMLLGFMDPTSLGDHDFFLERTHGVSGLEDCGKGLMRTVYGYGPTTCPFQYTHGLILIFPCNILRNFDSFAAGLLHDTGATAKVVGEWIENFRYFAEECDTLTSVHVFADVYDGFSILTHDIVQEIRDDYRVSRYLYGPSLNRSSCAVRKWRKIQKARQYERKRTLQSLSF